VRGLPRKAGCVKSRWPDRLGADAGDWSWRTDATTGRCGGHLGIHWSRRLASPVAGTSGGARGARWRLEPSVCIAPEPDNGNGDERFGQFKGLELNVLGRPVHGDGRAQMPMDPTVGDCGGGPSPTNSDLRLLTGSDDTRPANGRGMRGR
jgi:hypothetical protein